MKDVGCMPWSPPIEIGCVLQDSLSLRSFSCKGQNILVSVPVPPGNGEARALKAGQNRGQSQDGAAGWAPRWQVPRFSLGCAGPGTAPVEPQVSLLQRLRAERSPSCVS